MKIALGIFAVAVLFNCLHASSLNNRDIPPHVSLQGLWPDNVTQHSGYITVNGTYQNGVHLFYWMFESRTNPQDAPLVLWLTGGPGCSSELALFYENGPYVVNDDLSLKVNPYSWNTFANLLYVDQPVGTGFSYADSQFDYVTNEDQVANDMYTFLENFFAMYPQYSKLPFYITGESYAGHYVPALSARILRGNQAKEAPYINLQGSAIGNGWVDPIIQYGAYSEFAYQNNLINEVSYDALRVAYIGCKGLIEAGVWPVALEECQLMVAAILAEAGNINVYDIRKQCTYPPLCYDFSNLDKFLAQPIVKKALGISPESDWTECNNEVHSLLLGDWISNLAVDVPMLLAQNNYSVLVYSGTEDFICNYIGGREWTAQLQWPGQQGFVNAPQKNWVVNGQTAGQSKSYQGFTFLEVYNAGHMVPLDQPANALEMLRKFVNKQPW